MNRNTADTINVLREMLLCDIDPEKVLYSPNIPLLYETGLIRAGLGGNFRNMKELRPIKYKEAISGADKEKQIKAINEEWEYVIKNNILKAIKHKDVQ